LVQSKKNACFQATFSAFRASVLKRINMLRKILIIITVITLVYSCRYDSLEDRNNNSNLIIKTGTVCGWCTVNDTLTITRTAVRYVNFTNCGSTKPAVSKAGQMQSAELDDLLGKLDFAELKKLDLNACNVCADGCDDWISFKKGTETHYIRFTRNDPKLQPIQAFIEQLYTLKSEYSLVN
jgi:hypothetical protein